MIEEGTKTVEENYKNWLMYSGMTEKEFLQVRYILDFKIQASENGKHTVIKIGYIKDGYFQVLGQPIIYITGDLNGFIDAVLLLLMMARKLDDKNDKAPKYEQRKDFFYNLVKNFSICRKEYIKLKNN